jgi:YVTN family beta-propeller protein
VSSTIPVGTQPVAIAITPDSAEVYVVNQGSNSVSVILTASDTVSATVTVGTNPNAIAITPTAV